MADHLYTATIEWRRDDGDFAKGRFSRAHIWRFDGGVEVPASASPLVVPKPFADENAIDPEEGLVASLSSCHMLTFIDMARRAGFVVDTYEDTAEGEMEPPATGSRPGARTATIASSGARAGARAAPARASSSIGRAASRAASRATTTR
jgi:organic hydroperoxide reductase OsmC/OhrA